MLWVPLPESTPSMAAISPCLSTTLPSPILLRRQSRWSPPPVAALPATRRNSYDIPPLPPPSPSAIAYPALTYSTTLHFKSTYNVKVTAYDDEPEDKLINRFRREVLKAGVLQECRRRRFFENKHDKIKRKAREASRRNRKRKPWSKFPEENKDESGKKDEFDDGDDNWDLPDVDVPYT